MTNTSAQTSLFHSSLNKQGGYKAASGVSGDSIISWFGQLEPFDFSDISPTTPQSTWPAPQDHPQSVPSRHSKSSHSVVCGSGTRGVAKSQGGSEGITALGDVINIGIVAPAP